MADIADQLDDYQKSVLREAMGGQPPAQMPFDLRARGGYQNGMASGDVSMMWRKLFDPQGRSSLELSGGVGGALGGGIRELQPHASVRYVRRF